MKLFCCRRKFSTGFNPLTFRSSSKSIINTVLFSIFCLSVRVIEALPILAYSGAWGGDDCNKKMVNKSILVCNFFSMQDNSFFYILKMLNYGTICKTLFSFTFITLRVCKKTFNIDDINKLKRPFHHENVCCICRSRLKESTSVVKI
jgi:hypothetical protein